tara:strand:- start:51 stop:329 length:279 start_codon:yes stop_codon:yes gene_type:complete
MIENKDIHNQFEGPFLNRNIKGHILKYVNNISLDKAMQTALSKNECSAFVVTDDNKTFFKTIDYENAINQVHTNDITQGHISYIKKPSQCGI